MKTNPMNSDLLERSWTAFQKCWPDQRDPECDIYRNSRYQVHLRRYSSSKENGLHLTHLSFKRIDQQIVIPYEDKVRIKDELVHHECEGVELYPARSREVDTANQFHLWMLSRFYRFPLRTDVYPQIALPTESTNEKDVLKEPWTPLVTTEKTEGGGMIYRNSRYRVSLQRFSSQEGEPDLVCLSLQRLDRIPLIPYRDRMRVKDELVHPECEGIELLPARSRVIAPTDGCVLWVVDDPTYRFPLGFSERFVSDVALDGTVQEPWPAGERPADCLSENALRNALRSAGFLGTERR